MARRRGDGPTVAIKVLHEVLACSARMIERFAREIEVLKRISHPGIVEVYEVGVLCDGRPFYAMEYLEGRTLDALLRAEGKLRPVDALELLEPVCAALEAVHRAGVVHRDVKASNILIVEGKPQQVKLLDFGIAKLLDPEEQRSGLTTAGKLHGTPTIMAPEQILGWRIDGRVDVYALGVLLHRMLTGRLPFESRNMEELVRKHLEEPPPRPSQRTPLAPALDAVVLRAMEKQPERRHASAKSFLRALREAVGRPAVARDSVPDLSAPACVVLTELWLREEGDELDEALASDIAYVLDLAEEWLRAGGLSLAATTGNSVLGVLLYEGEPLRLRERRRAVITAAAELYEALSRRAGADERVHVNMCVHAGRVSVRLTTQAPEIVGGAPLSSGSWAPAEQVRGLCVTRDAMDGIDDLVSSSGPGEYVIVGRRPQGPRRRSSETTLRIVYEPAEDGIRTGDRGQQRARGEAAFRE